MSIRNLFSNFRQKAKHFWYYNKVVTVIVGGVAAAGCIVVILPYYNREHYRTVQKDVWKGIDRTQYQGGMKPWSDPFDRNKSEMKKPYQSSE